MQEEKAFVQARTLEEQKALNSGVARDAAKMQGDNTQLQTELQSDAEVLRDYVSETSKGFVPNLQEHLTPFIVGGTTEAIQGRIGFLTRDPGEVMHVVHLHEQRETEMATYLETVVAPAVGERPAEGRYAVHALVYFESQPEQLREHVGALLLSFGRTVVATSDVSAATDMTPTERSAL